MNADRASRAHSSVRAAIDFMAQAGRADHYLACHHEAGGGWCACGMHRHPCPIRGLAEKAAELAARRAARDARRLIAGVGDPAPVVGGTDALRGRAS